MQTIYTDLLCIGAGLSGERVAIDAAEAGFNVICLSVVHSRRSHSSAAQGGMQAALGNNVMAEGDTPDIHFQDTVKGSDWGCDQEAAWTFAKNAPIAMRQMAYWGVPWNRVVPGEHTYYKGGKPFTAVEKKEKEGLITARNFGGTAKWRTCFTSDGAGHSVLVTLDNKLASTGAQVHDKVEAISLIHDGETCMGCVARCLKTGEMRVYIAKATVLATGGYGRIYRASTNAIICDGSGAILALDTGLAPLGNMEAVQFHPTGLVPTDILVTEGCRGDGGTLLDKNLHRFMPDYEPDKAELASRDVVSRRMIEHMRKGMGVASPYGDHLWLDIRHLGCHHIQTKLREVDEICKNFLGVDATHQLIPVRPTQHYSMGGVRTNRDGHAYGLKGLFSVGEGACWDMHGFNRLGGNSLAETIVAGMVTGRKITEFLKGWETVIKTQTVTDAIKAQTARIAGLVNGSNGKESAYAVREAMYDALAEGAYVFRTGAGLQKCVDTLQDVLARSRKVGLASSGLGANAELALALKIEGMVKLALCVAYGGLMRTESRGSHAREDYPERNDAEWLNRTLAYWPNHSDTLPTLKYEPATEKFFIPPGERGYGGGKIIPMDPAKVQAMTFDKE